jgi:histidyl-tRNA synthetase
MANQINPPRGMRDFLPAEKLKRSQVLTSILESYRVRGFQEIETPALESIERLTSGQGGDNEKLAFRVLKRGEELDQALNSNAPDNLSDLGLRYDLTVPLTRFYATNYSKLPKVFKAIQIGPVWRAERPQKGRYRQFVQCDIDIIGDASQLAEVELLIASLSALSKLGLDEAVIRVNHRELLINSLSNLGLAESDIASAMITVDKLDKIGIEGVVEELGDRYGIADTARSWLTGISLEVEVPSELREIFDEVEKIFPNRLRFDPTLVRGMGYYTGAIFEIEHPGSGSSIGGGGRYDGMIGKWLGSEVPAVGISLGFERILDLVEQSESQQKALILVFDPEQRSLALSIQNEAISAGYLARLEPRPKKLNSLLDSLHSEGYESFAFIDGSALQFSDLVIKPIG